MNLSISGKGTTQIIIIAASRDKTRLGLDKVKPKAWFRSRWGTILKLSYFLNFFVGHLLYA